MWIEKRGRQRRVYYRTRNETSPQKAFEPFSSRDQAEAFLTLARASNPTGDLAYVRDPHPDTLMSLLGRSPVVQEPVTSTAELAITGRVRTTDVMGRYSPLVA